MKFLFTFPKDDSESDTFQDTIYKVESPIYAESTIYRSQCTFDVSKLTLLANLSDSLVLIFGFLCFFLFFSYYL